MCSNGSVLWLSADGSSVCLGGRCRAAGRRWEGKDAAAAVPRVALVRLCLALRGDLTRGRLGLG